MYVREQPSVDSNYKFILNKDDVVIILDKKIDKYFYKIEVEVTNISNKEEHINVEGYCMKKFIKII